MKETKSSSAVIQPTLIPTQLGINCVKTTFSNKPRPFIDWTMTFTQKEQKTEKHVKIEEYLLDPSIDQSICAWADHQFQSLSELVYKHYVQYANLITPSFNLTNLITYNEARVGFIVKKIKELINGKGIDSTYCIILNKSTYDQEFINDIVNKLIKAEINTSSVVIVNNQSIQNEDIIISRLNKPEFKNDVSGHYLFYNNERFTIKYIGTSIQNIPDSYIIRKSAFKKDLACFKNLQSDTELFDPIYENLTTFEFLTHGEYLSRNLNFNGTRLEVELKETADIITSQLTHFNYDSNYEYCNIEFNLNVNHNLVIEPIASFKKWFDSNTQFYIECSKHVKNGDIYAKCAFEVSLATEFKNIEQELFKDLFNTDIISTKIKKLVLNFKILKTDFKYFESSQK